MQGKLIDGKELGLSHKNYISGYITRKLGVDAVNNYYAHAANRRGIDFTSVTLESLNIKYRVSPEDLSNIPLQGPAVVVCNHPMGLLDGIMLIDLLGKVRKDVKFLGNFLLMRLKTLEDFFLPVDPFHHRRSANASGIKKAMEHLSGGGLLVVFPAGEVSTVRRNLVVEDKPWSGVIMRMIRKASVPVVPLYIHGANSTAFHLVGKIHPVLRTLRLPIELYNKQNRTFDIRIASPLLPARTADLPDTAAYTAFLRANVYYMRDSFERPWHRVVLRKRKPQVPASQPVAAEIDPAVLKQELEAIGPESLLFSNRDYSVYLAAYEQIPNIINEIGRLREMTFREIGEGTGKAYDLDAFDRYYRHLFIYNTRTGEIVGSYRLGMGDRIMAEYGKTGFYTDTLFHFSGDFVKIMGSTMELGRSFVISRYQKNAMPLMLLWKGIMITLLRTPNLHYLFGAVSVSGEYRDISKRLIISYLTRYHRDQRFSPCVKPRIGIKGIAKKDVSLMKDISSLELVDKIVRDVETDSGIPVLMKKYLQLGGKILAFNIDPDFCNSLDAFLLLDISTVPSRTLEMLSKEQDMKDIRQRFYNN